VEGGRAARAMSAREGRGTASQLALRFCLSYAAVSSAIPGMLTATEVEENAAACDLAELPATLLPEIAHIYATANPAVDKPIDPGKLDRALAD
jgi:aryl-alcohol dehydrogenase-like predicted oxidoreductase